MHKKLYRSREDRIISGVMGGLGEYFNVDPVILRLLYVLVAIATGIIPGVVVYLVAVFVVPEAPTISPSTPISDDGPAV